MNQQKNKPKDNPGQGASADQVVERLSLTATAVLCTLALTGRPTSLEALVYRLGLEPGRIAGSLLWLRHHGIVRDRCGFWSIQTPGWSFTLAAAVRQ